MEYEYQVCLSFAGEQREYVQQVYDDLESRHIKVFYDKQFETELWGENLIEVFHRIYKSAQYCVMFISKEYADKAWTHFEQISALERQVYKNEAYILPVRFDNTELPGLSSAILYLDANTMTPKEIADKIEFKVKKNNHCNVTTEKLDTEEYTKKICEHLKNTLYKQNNHLFIEVRNRNYIVIFTLMDEKECCHMQIEVSGLNEMHIKNIDFFNYSITENTITEKSLYDMFQRKMEDQ